MSYQRSHRRRHRRSAGAAFAAALLAVSPLSGQDAAADPHLERGRALTEAFYAGELDGIVASFNAPMRDALGGVEGLAAFRDQLAAQLGAEAEVVREAVRDVQGHRVYQRVVRYENAPTPFVVTWAFDAADQIAGFSIQADQGQPTEAESRHLDYRTRAALRLPFEEEFTVFWGGRTVEQNYHAAHRDQRFALDLVVVRDGTRHRGDGRTNEDYHCWGSPIVAPAAGTVRAVRDGLPDNVPGEMDASVPPGNHVVLDHGNAEYSFLAHLQQGTVRVEAGDVVASGDTLGLCGNSGNSSEPHLHYHLQNTPVFGQGEGLPAQFLDYLADGEPVARGEPVQGQAVRPRG